MVLKKSCTGTNPVIDFADKLNSSRPSCNVRLPQDIYQTAKISKLLLLMERGVDIIKVNHYMKLISTHKKSWLKKNRKMMMILKTYIQLQYLIH
ncbi:uncharacterized protein isoform X3 [Leptinotarsa decemlineata]|uniref:uncharacterized protein isoform X3 n=1 Tax=Leptinotarsa decemlineata TaxID=7539 RepID=UPI003D307B5B